jgi:hypothetical protein
MWIFFLKEQILPFFGGIYLNSLANVCGGFRTMNTHTHTQFKTSMDEVHEKSTFCIYIIVVLDL